MTDDTRPLTRSQHLHRLAAWVLGTPADDLTPMTDRRAIEVLAGAHASDAATLSRLEHLSIADLAAEAPFAAQHWRGLTPTPADVILRDRSRSRAEGSAP